MKVRDRGGGPRRAIARVASYLREAFEGLGRRMTSRRARALATALALLLSNVLAAVCPVAAYAISFEPITVERVSEDEFEEPGFSWSIDFEDAVIEPGSSFVWKDDLSGHFACDPRYDNANDPNSHWSIAKRAGGWAAYIDGDTPDDTDFTLRFTGGMFEDKAIDALVTISDWTYKEPLDGNWNVGTPTEYWSDFRTGVFMMRGYRSVTDAKDGEGMQTLSFYTVGMADIEVEIRFVLANTNTPVELRGHLTTTDLDLQQSFSFGGACTKARMSALNDYLYLNEVDNLIMSPDSRNGVPGAGLDDKIPEDWRDGMVEAYFDTSESVGNLGEPLKFYFGSSYGAGGTPESIFFLCTEYITAPPTYPDEKIEHPVKTADPATGVSVGDHVTFTVDAPMHEQGVNCRWGYRYTSCEIVDVLPPEMRYVEGSGKLLDESGSDVTSLGTIAYDGDDSSPNENTVRFEFDREQLETLELTGQHYRFVFEAELTEYPNSNLLKVTNNSYVRVNGGDDNEAPPVDVELLEPKFSVDKSADKYEWEVGDAVHFIVRYEQTVENAQSRSTVISDNLPEYLELKAETVKASGVKDLPPVEVNANEWSINFDKFNYGDELVVEYDAVVRQSGNGKEIVNQAAIHAINTPDEDDPEEIWANTANVEVEKDVDRYEGYVEASDQDPGFFEYTVTFRNTQEGTVANNVAVTDDSLPEGMRLGRNDDGSLMIMSVTQDGAKVTMNRDQDQYSGTLKDIPYRVGEAEGQDPFDGDFEHDQVVTMTPTWEISPRGTGWEMHLDRLAHGTDVALTYRAYPEDTVSGWEIENQAGITADNSQPDEDTAIVWVNQPHFAIDKQASNDTFTVNDEILYEVKVTNSTPGTLARNVVISDLAHTQGVELLHDTIKVYDSEGKDITGSCTINYKHNPYDGETFIVETNRDLIAGMTDEMRELYERLMATTTEADFNEVLSQIKQAIADGKGANHDEITVAIPGRPVWRDGSIVWLGGSNPLDVDQQSPRPGSLSCETELVVCYRVKISDAELAGQTVDNTALVVSDEPNTETTDDEVVDVKGPRLVIDKTSDKDVYQAGETGHYTLVATQTREDNVAQGVVISDLMDERDVASIVHGSVRATGPDGQAIQTEPAYVSDESGKIVGFTLETGADLADEQSVTVTYDVVFEKAGSTLHNVAQDNATNAVGGTDDNTVEVVEPRATVQLDKAVDRETVRVGEWATYTVTATVADNPAKNVVITDKSLPETMPVDLRGITLQVNGIGVGDFQLDVEGNGFAAHLGDLNPGDVAKITYRAQARDEGLLGTSVVNTATLTADTLDEPLRDDASVTIPPDEPEVTLEKSVDREKIWVGEIVSYTVEATIAQDSDGAQGVVIGDASLPEGMAIDMASIRAWLNDREITPVTADIEGNAFSIPFGDLRPGETVRITYDATATDVGLAGTSVTNVATLASSSLDDPLEATATVSVAAPGETVLDKRASLERAKVGEVISYSVRAVAGADLTEAVITDEGLPESVEIDPVTVRSAINGNALDTVATMEDEGFSLQLGTLKVGDVVEVSYEAVVREGVEADEAVNVARLSSPNLPGPVEDDETVQIVDDPDVSPPDDPDGPDDPGTPGTPGDPGNPDDPGEPQDPDDPNNPEDPSTPLEKAADKDVASVGETVSYTVTAIAEADLADAVLSDSGLSEGAGIDEQTIVVSVNGAEREDLAPAMDGTGFSLELGSLAAGDVVEVTYQVLVEDEGLAGEALVNLALLESVSLPEPLEATETVEVTDEETPGGKNGEPQGLVTSPGGGGSFPNTGQSASATLLIVFGAGVAVAATIVRIRQRPQRRPRR